MSRAKALSSDLLNEQINTSHLVYYWSHLFLTLLIASPRAPYIPSPLSPSFLTLAYTPLLWEALMN
jgi:hypothetical protein